MKFNYLSVFWLVGTYLVLNVFELNPSVMASHYTSEESLSPRSPPIAIQHFCAEKEEGIDNHTESNKYLLCDTLVWDKLSDIDIMDLIPRLGKDIKKFECTNGYLTTGGISLLTPHLKNLNRVFFQKCPNLTDKCLEILSQNCPLLAIVTLNNCRQFTNTAIGRMVMALPHLSSLTLAWCHVDDTLLTQIADGAAQLKHLNLRGSDITDAGIAYLLSQPTCRLETLTLADCYYITRASVDTAHKNLFLKKLDVKNCEKISPIEIAVYDLNPESHLTVIF